MQDSKIEWCHDTASLWWGCTEVHEGCDHCYAKAWANWKAPVTVWGNQSPRLEVKSVWSNLKRFQRLAIETDETRRVFVGSMMDIFEKEFPLANRAGKPVEIDGKLISTGYLRQRFFNTVVPESPDLDFLLLTKRPSNINKYTPTAWQFRPPTNVMFGCSVVSPGTLFLVDQLRQVAGRRFLSIEPQLEYIPDIDLTGIDWVICGGESGPKRRPFNADWGRRLRDICREQHTAFFFKQMDKVLPIPDDLLIRQFPTRP